MDPSGVKRRFFRKTGSSSSTTSSRTTQHSLDSLSPSQSPLHSHSPSLENTSLAGLALTMNLPPHLSSSYAAARAKPGNSMSLDEAEHKMSRNPRFNGAPRRARSAERFDGMRINSTNAPGKLQAVDLYNLIREFLRLITIIDCQSLYLGFILSFQL